MSVRHLDRFFTPRSVAMIGASARPGSVGATVLANLASGGLHGRMGLDRRGAHGRCVLSACSVGDQ
jgi:hypothetical protein